jgi:hypothetical protein
MMIYYVVIDTSAETAAPLDMYVSNCDSTHDYEPAPLPPPPPDDSERELWAERAHFSGEPMTRPVFAVNPVRWEYG